jgi:hypothetical protein
MENAALFSVAPAVSSAGMLFFTPAANMFGSASCTVRLTETRPEGASLPEWPTAPLTIVVTAGEAQNLSR